MKAIVIEKFGGPEVLKVKEVADPMAGPNEVKIRVHYTAVNPVDWKIREGYLAEMLPHKFPLILGWDAAGIVESVGAGVKNFKTGDQVYAYARKPQVQHGTYAEFVTLDEKAVALIPSSLKLEQAATVPLVGLTAWQSLHDLGKITAGQKVLVLGGAGGVGGFAVALAKAAGAFVVATASAKNHDYVKGLGADTVIDYQDPLWAKRLRGKFPEGFHMVFDTVGGENLQAAYDLVLRGGSLISISETPDAERSKNLGIATSIFHFVEPSGEELTQIGRLIDQGAVKIPSFQVMPLEEVGDAHRLSQTGHVRGKILLKVA